MDSQCAPAEQLSALYRAILDAVAELERRGRRSDAAQIRAEATQTYSASWDEAAHRRLEQLHARAWSLISGGETNPRHRTRRLLFRWS